MDDFTGKEVKGYELLEEIGVGGFGAVYRAFQESVGREVAIKIILPQFANRPEFIRSFENEAQLVARLEHPHIVPLFDYWREPEGAFLVMRMLRHNLREAIAEGPFDMERAAAVLDQIAAGLAVSHRNGVVHRDIKPANILMDDDGNAYLADFGIAKVVSEGEDEDGEALLSGSPAYMAPEQATASEITPQTDIYALGVLLFEMLTGRQPFYDMTAAEMIFKHISEPLPSVFAFRQDLPETVDEVVQKATAKDPLDRYPDALSLADGFRRIFSGTLDVEDEPAMSAAEVADIPNPYKGLRAFEEVDAHDFFGREVLTGELLERLAEDHPMNRFLSVIGPSGSGKSSVVKAGVLPALRNNAIEGSSYWFIAELVPDIHPLQELESALLSVGYNPVSNLMEILTASSTGLINAVNQILPGGGDLLLVIDQFEEAFTMAEDEEERAQFLELIRTAVSTPESRVRVIVTLRADFMDQPLGYPGYGELIRRRTEFVLPLSTDEIERAITGPADRVGLQVGPELLTAVVSDIREEPGALPLLQYALTEVFERRAGRVLSLDAYIASGGALGALARRAEELYEDMNPDSQSATRQLFLRLVTLGEGTQDTRRRVGWTEIKSIAAENPAMVDVRDLFVKYRLLTSDRDPQTREPTIEVAHEALLREWKRLREWLNSSREDVRIQRRLLSAASEWREHERDKSYLMAGSQLDQVAEWAGKTDLAMSEEERAFLAASLVNKRQIDAREKARRIQQIELERRARNRWQILTAVMTVAVGLALGLTLFFFREVQLRDSTLQEVTATQGAALSQLANAQATVSALQQEGGEADHSLALIEGARAALDDDDTELSFTLALLAANEPEPHPDVVVLLADLLDIPDDDRDSVTLGELVELAEAADRDRELTCEERLTFDVAPLCDE